MLKAGLAEEKEQLAKAGAKPKSSAEKKEITSKVDDKKIIHSQGDGYYFIHTVDFGDIEVREREYQKVFIGDNITFDTESSWGIYNILKINGGKINGEI